jgi:hypothetical protein
MLRYRINQGAPAPQHPNNAQALKYLHEHFGTRCFTRSQAEKWLKSKGLSLYDAGVYFCALYHDSNNIVEKKRD